MYTAENPLEGLLQSRKLRELLSRIESDIKFAGGEVGALFVALKVLFAEYMDLDAKTSFMGLYVRHRDLLILGPYVGLPTVHNLIPISRGVVGRCADLDQTLVIGDVSACDYYIECCEDVKSEIVLPIRTSNSAVIGVLDLDSPKVNAYADSDQETLQRIANLIKQPCRLLESVVTIQIGGWPHGESQPRATP